MDTRETDKINYDELELAFISEKCLSAQVGPHDIIFVELRDMNRKTIDAWLDMSLQYRKEWDAHKPLPVVVDTSSLRFAFSPYFFSKGSDLMAVRPELTTYISWIINDNFVGQLMRGMIGRGTRNSHYNLCYSRQDAFEWIEEKCVSHYEE